MNTFPFGTPIRPVAQTDRTPRRIFVLGVYSSAVHARWIGPDGRPLVNALAVASEPEIFWRGNGAADIIAGIKLPDGAGRLEPADDRFNGSSGASLDKDFLAPLKLSRADAWLCDLLPESRCNDSQRDALKRAYRPRMEALELPEYNFPSVPTNLASVERVKQIAQEISEAKPDVMVTLGDQPLRWFASHFGAKSRLADYADTPDNYGRTQELQVAGQKLQLLPLVHPRQAAGLGKHCANWAQLHRHWAERRGREH